MSHHELHRTQRAGWLRAAVMGANDGIVSTASLIIGVASANASIDAILLAGIAGLVAGAMSMAAGEYVSVCSQVDIEKADLEMERISLETDYEFEKEELAEIYVERGLEATLAFEVATQLMEHDALGAHARDEIGIVEETRAQPLLAAGSSAATFTAGAALPLLTAWLVPLEILAPAVAALSLVFLAGLGALAARTGGAPVLRGLVRVTFWGAAAMAITAMVGSLVGVAV